MDDTAYERKDLENLSKSDLIELILRLHSDRDNSADVALPPPPPLRLGVHVGKRYDEEQREKLQILKAHIDEQTKISSVIVVTAYLRELQEAEIHESKHALFQNLPQRVIHLCYRYCTDVLKHYFAFMLFSNEHDIIVHGMQQRRAQPPHIHMFTIRDIGPRQVNKTPVYKLTPDASVQEIDVKYVQHYTPYLHLSPKVFGSMKGNHSKRTPLSAVFRAFSTQVQDPSEFDMLYWKSPYFYDYPAAAAGAVPGNEDLLYYRRKLPAMPHTEYVRRTTSLFHVPVSNQLLAFHESSGDKSKCVSVFDVHNMRWMSNSNNYKCVQLQEAKRLLPIKCLYEDRLFLCGGLKGRATNIVETLNCALIADLLRDLQLSEQAGLDEDVSVAPARRNGHGRRVQSVTMRSRMTMPRGYGDADVVSVKNQIVVGGGDSIEFYDMHKDAWFLHGARIENTNYWWRRFDNQTPIVRCFGNVVFMTSGTSSGLESRSEMKPLHGIGRIHCVDIRENSNKWQVFTDRTFDKIMNFWVNNTRVLVSGVFL